MSKHTRGPWIAASAASSIVGLPVVAQSGRSICSVTFFNLGEHFPEHDRESRANARLIAAAPDLVEALKAISDMFMSRPDMLRAITPLCGAAEHAVFDLARAAVAKAEGPDEVEEQGIGVIADEPPPHR